MATTEINKTKILVKVHEPLIAIMQHKIDSACLKRDAYLDKALRVEAELLRKEIATPNSDKAKNYIAAQLSDLKLKPLNLLLSTETVDLINEVCKEKNVPRDAFMNRFFLLLIANDTVLTALFSEFLSLADLETMGEFSERHGWDCDVDTDFYPNPMSIELMFRTKVALDNIEEIVTESSPFLSTRIFINYLLSKYDEEKICNYRSAMYSYPFAESALKNLPDEYDFLRVDNSFGFNPYMSDSFIETNKELKELFSDLSDEVLKKDKLLGSIEKEKQAKKEKQQKNFERLEKRRAKIEGEAK